MSKGSPFARQTRQQITKNPINTSPSKMMWSFSKKRRFSLNKPPCPYVSYIQNMSTINKRKTVFGSSKRRVFSQVSEVPSSDTYNPGKQKAPNIPVFALSRDVTYPIKIELCRKFISYNTSRTSNSNFKKIPGPGRYGSFSESKGKKGFSMRPKTANNRTCTFIPNKDFIENQELKIVPSPFEYQNVEHAIGKQTVSKFRSVTLGNATLQSTNSRFKQISQKSPGPFVYHPKKYAITKFSKGGKIGRCNRLSFIDHASTTSYTPGPGKYQAPTQFAHYKSRELS